MNGRRMAFAGMALLFSAAVFGVPAWASGAPGEGPQGVAKNFALDSILTTRAHLGGVSITVTCPSPSTNRWIGLAAANGVVEFPSEPRKARALASIQVFRIEPSPKGLQLEEELSFKDGIAVQLESRGQRLDRILLFAPGRPGAPPLTIVVSPDMIGKGLFEIGGFAVLVDRFDAEVIRFTCLRWPAGDPIICYF